MNAEREDNDFFEGSVMILIIGSGVSSLVFAERCRQNGEEFRIFEKESKIGGKCITYTSKCKKALFDVAGHFLHYNGEKPVVCDRILDFPVRDRISKVLFDGRILDYPIQQSIRAHDIKLINVPRWSDYPQNSMTKFFVDKFGELAWHFFVPYNRKIWSMSTDLLEQDYYEELRSPVKGAGYNDKFMYPDRGVEDIPIKIREHVYSKIERGNIVEIDPVNKVAFVDGIGSVKYDRLISPIPLIDLCKITKGYESLSCGLKWSSVIIFNIAYKKHNALYDGVSWLYIGTHRHRFFRCGWYNHVSSHMADEGFESLYVEVSYPGEMDGRVSVKDIQAEVIQDLMHLNIIEKQEYISSIDSIVVEKAYPLSVNNKSKRVQMILNAFMSNNIYPVGRYGLWRWTGMYEDMKYSENLYNYLFCNGAQPSLFGY